MLKVFFLIYVQNSLQGVSDTLYNIQSGGNVRGLCRGVWFYLRMDMSGNYIKHI